MKKLTYILAVTLIFGVTAPCVATVASSPQTAQSSTAKPAANIEMIRVCSLFHGLTELTEYILNSNELDPSILDIYIDTINRISTYSDCDKKMNETDLNMLVDAFEAFAKAGQSALPREDIYADLSRFETIGDAVGYLSEALNAGME